MKFLITSLAILFFSANALAQENEVYEYLTIVQKANDLKIGFGEGEFESINIKEERTGDESDHRPLLKRITEFEKERWELILRNSSTPLNMD